MRRAGTIVIGGGQAGLAMSRCLLDEGQDHVVLERGRVGERWRSERWDSLRLLTPSWQSRLPGLARPAGDPDAFMTMDELVALLEGYARSFGAPVETGTTVTRVTARAHGFTVETDRGAFEGRNVVVATGHCDRPFVPRIAANLSPAIHQLTPSRYRSPEALPDGGVLVVGAAASGSQIAAELARAGRRVTLAVGGHTRLPRRYRGRDILFWLDACGVLGEEVEGPRKQASFQLTGGGGEIDLPTLAALGVRLTGRLASTDGARVTFASDLAATAAAADARLARVLDRIDAFIAARGHDAPPGLRPPRARPAEGPAALDLEAERIGTVIWATGYVRRYPWLAVPGVLDRSGEIVHRHGVTPASGLYALGLRMQRTRRSSFIDGVGDDARFLAARIAARTPCRRSLAA